MKHQYFYEDLCVALRNFFSCDQGQGDSLAGFSSVRALLKEREEKEVEDAFLKNQNNEEEQMMERSATVEEKVEDALGYLLDLAIKRFGYAARDVFEAVFDFNSATIHSQHAFNINFQKLKHIVESRATNGAVKVELSHRIVSISPIYSASDPFERIDWKVDFNSNWVATEIMKKLNIAENRDIEFRQVIHFFRGIPQAGSMIGSLFESLAHTVIPIRKLRQTSQSSSFPSRRLPIMQSNFTNVHARSPTLNPSASCPHSMTRSTIYLTRMRRMLRC